MKLKIVLTVLSAFLICRCSLMAQTTVFTYQGQLARDGAPANGTNSMKFSLWDAVTNGAVVGGPVTNSAISVSNGFFSVALDFGSAPFTGAGRWLEIGIGSNTTFITLSPRQRLTSSPYSITALNASNFLGTLPASQLSGTIADARLSTNIARLNTNQTFTGVNTFSNVTFNGMYSLTASTISPGSGATITPLRSFYRLAPTGPVNLSMSTAVASVSTVGTVLILQGTDNINTVTINDGANVQLALLSRTLGADDTLTLIWSGTDWVEVSFANNL